MSTRDGEWRLYSNPVDGSAPATELLDDGGVPYSWSPDRNHLAIGTDTGLHLLAANGSGELHDFVTSPFTEATPMFSPKGKWIVYASDDTGRFEIYVRERDGSRPRIPVSRNGGRWPMWSKRGDEIFYRQGRRMMSVSVEGDDELVLSEPRVLFEGDFTDGQIGLPNYDVAADGQTFVIVIHHDGTLVPQINVVLNWDQELKRLVPPMAW
jgi:hypothetical protein